MGTTISNTGIITEGSKPVPLRIKGSHGAPTLGFNTMYAKGDFAGGVLKLYGSPHTEFDPAFPYGDVELSGNGCVAFLGRADTFWLQLENVTAGQEPNVEFWVL